VHEVHEEVADHVPDFVPFVFFVVKV